MFNIDNKWLLITASFTLYFLVIYSFKRIGSHNLKHALGRHNGTALLNLKHSIGILLFGVLFFYQTPEYLYLITEVEIPRLPALALILITFFLSAYLAYRFFLKERNKLSRESKTSPSQAWMYFAIRFAFLFCYEFFFRGVLLFSFLEISEPYLAICYVTALYVLIHAFDSKKELIGSIPFGVVLAIFTLITNSIWYAFFIHLALSAVYEISVFCHQTFKNVSNG